MKSLFFIAAVAIISQVRPSAGLVFDTIGSLTGGGGGDSSGYGANSETARSAAYFVIGFINSNTQYCTNLASIESSQKKTSGLDVLGLGIATLFPGGTNIELSFTVKAWVSGYWQQVSCNAIVSSKDAAYRLGQYKCPALGISFPGGSKK